MSCHPFVVLAEAGFVPLLVGGTYVSVYGLEATVVVITTLLCELLRVKLLPAILGCVLCGLLCLSSGRDHVTAAMLHIVMIEKNIECILNMLL